MGLRMVQLTLVVQRQARGRMGVPLSEESDYRLLGSRLLILRVYPCAPPDRRVACAAGVR